MARRFGRVNTVNRGVLRRCAMSGLRFYESEMIRRGGLWYHPKWYDPDRQLKAKRQRFGPNL